MTLGPAVDREKIPSVRCQQKVMLERERERKSFIRNWHTENLRD
jgi:hypothetical protein